MNRLQALGLFISFVGISVEIMMVNTGSDIMVYLSVLIIIAGGAMLLLNS